MIVFGREIFRFFALVFPCFTLFFGRIFQNVVIYLRNLLIFDFSFIFPLLNFLNFEVFLSIFSFLIFLHFSSYPGQPHGPQPASAKYARENCFPFF